MNGQCVQKELRSLECGDFCLASSPPDQQCFCSKNKTNYLVKKAQKKHLRTHVSCLKVCEEVGRCALQNGQCIAKSIGDCLASEACLNHGQCALSNGRCVANEQGCRQSLSCEILGQCSFKNGACAVGDVGDCTKALVCTEGQRCEFEEAESQGISQCIVPVTQLDCTDLCRRSGLCMARGDRCVAETHGHCVRSDACKLYGYCHEEQGKCVAFSDRDCRRGLNCKRFGKCKARNRRCVK